MADPFVEQLGRKAASLSTEIPGEQFALGSMVSCEAAARVGELLDGCAQQRRIVTGGTVDGAMVQPTVVDHHERNAAVCRSRSAQS